MRKQAGTPQKKAGSASFREKASYVYDYRGLCGEKKTPAGSEYREYTADGKLLYTEKGEDRTDYIYKSNTVFAKIRREREGEAVYYHHTDHLGTTKAISDGEGKVVWEAETEALGSVLSENGTKGFTASFTGKLYDEDAGMYYFNARWYDSELGRFVTQDPARDGGNWYAYCNNSPLNFKDPTGLSTQVDEKTGTIIGATDDGECGVYAYPTFDGQRAEGPAFPIGLTGTPGYFVSTPSNPGNIQIAGQDQNYIGKNINDYGSGFAYGDFQFTLPKEDIIGTALPTFQDYVDIFQGCLNPLGDIVSYASIGLNIASVTCTLTGNVAIAECLDLAAATCDIVATGLYFASGNKEKAAVALTATLMDFVPGPYKFNKGANRYISSTTGRFVSTSLGRQGAILPKTFGMALGLNLLKINEE